MEAAASSREPRTHAGEGSKVSGRKPNLGARSSRRNSRRRFRFLMARVGQQGTPSNEAHDAERRGEAPIQTQAQRRPHRHASPRHSRHPGPRPLPEVTRYRCGMLKLGKMPLEVTAQTPLFKKA